MLHIQKIGFFDNIVKESKIRLTIGKLVFSEDQTKRYILTFFAIIFFTAGAALSDTVTQEVVNVQKYVKGKTTLKLSGTLSETAMKALAEGESSFSICNALGSCLSVPTLLPEAKNGFGTKTATQKISVKSKKGKFSWAEKDVAANFAFVVGTETNKPTQASLKSSGTIDTKEIDNFKTQKAAVLDILSHENSSGSVAAYAFTPELVGKNFKHASKGADLQVKFSANAKGKATAAFKFLPNAASPAFVGGYVPPAPPAETNRLYMVIDLSGGTNATSFAISYLDDVPEGGWTEEYKTTKLVLRRIEPGTFVMGCPTNELGRIPIDVGIFETQHQVTLTNAFYIGVFETTQKQYELITGMEPSEYVGATRPVESVSYDMLRGNDKGASWPYGYDVDEDSFFGKLRSKTQMTFDLPTEAQWEYACRAGTTTALNDGSNITNTYSDGSLAKLARYCFNRDDGKGGYGEHTAVGSYQPNAWDLYDMLGNVYEWCRDWFEEDLGTTPATEPYGPSVGSLRVIRGGGWNLLAYSCRSANRYYRGYPHRCSNLSGFRVVLVQSE